MPKPKQQIPKRIYYCPLHDVVKSKLGDCSWHFNKNKCMVSDKKCEAITVCVVPCTIDPALVLEVESMIEEYDKASPPMDRPRFAVQLIEKARGY